MEIFTTQDNLIIIKGVTEILIIGVLRGGPGGPWPPPWQKYLTWQNRNVWLGRKEIDSLAENI